MENQRDTAGNCQVVRGQLVAGLRLGKEHRDARVRVLALLVWRPPRRGAPQRNAWGVGLERPIWGCGGGVTRV